MRVVIVGRHDRMVSQFKKICKSYNCKAKVFTQMAANLKDQIGSPDLVVVFTNTVSHKMVRCVLTEAERCKADIVRCHTSSGTALNEILQSKGRVSKLTFKVMIEARPFFGGKKIGLTVM